MLEYTLYTLYTLHTLYKRITFNIEKCLELDLLHSMKTLAIRKFLSWEYYLKFVETAEFIDGD